MKSIFIAIFAMLGGGVGYLLRPAVPFIGQLPLNIIIADGKNLHGLERLAQPYAQQSLEYVIAGALVGGMLGLITAYLYNLRQPDGTDGNRHPRTPSGP